MEEINKNVWKRLPGGQLFLVLTEVFLQICYKKTQLTDCERNVIIKEV
jgi:hypothetical protein